MEAAARRPRQRATSYYESLPTVMVMEEMPTPRESHLLLRGAYDQPGEKVTPALPGVPGAAARGRAGSPNNRLGLAQWLVDPVEPADWRA